MKKIILSLCLIATLLFPIFPPRASAQDTEAYNPDPKAIAVALKPLAGQWNVGLCGQQNYRGYHGTLTAANTGTFFNFTSVAVEDGSVTGIASGDFKFNVTFLISGDEETRFVAKYAEPQNGFAIYFAAESYSTDRFMAIVKDTYGGTYIIFARRGVESDLSTMTASDLGKNGLCTAARALELDDALNSARKWAQKQN
jgi:hypothetical protein